MRQKHLATGICACAGMLILILDGKTALAGAQEGLELCIKTVVPSLFPFILLSILLSGSFSASPLSVLRPLEHFCGIPEGSGPLLLSGFLGGYPTGAQSVAIAYTSGQLQKENADRMMAFCNNAGPAFLFGMVSAVFPNPSAPFLLWGIHLGSALLTAVLLPAFPSAPTVKTEKKQLTLAEAMRTAITVTANICGWVILFRIIIAFLTGWILWLLPPEGQVTITGILELTNGCCELSRISDPELRFVICSGLLAWGGVCVTMQTHSVAANLSMKSYLKGKLLQTMFSLLLSSCVVLNIWLPAVILLILLTGIIQKTQKRGRNSTTVVV